MTFEPVFSKSQLPKPYLRDRKIDPYLPPASPPTPEQLVPQIPPDIRNMHCHIIGKTGQGKTTLLANQAVCDINANRGGVCVIDPKGGVDGFVDIVARFIPESRLDDCIWLDINDPIPLDIISCVPGKEAAMVSGLSYILTRGELDKTYAPDLTRNINNLLYTLIYANSNPLMKDEDRCTLLDVQRFFFDVERKKFILSHLKHPVLQSFWNNKNEYPDAKGQSRITSRINEYIMSNSLATILGEPKPRLNIQEVVDKGKILLVTVPDDDDAATEYGSLLVAKIQQAAFSRRSPDERSEQIPPFFLYIDEFEYFRASSKFKKMLKMARSFNLCLTLANLELSELDNDIASALGTVSSFIVLKINTRDKHAFTDVIGAHDPGEALRDRERAAFHEWNVAPSDASLRKWNIAKERLKDHPDKIVTVEDAIKLRRFEAIYKFGDDAPIRRPIPTKPPEPTQRQLDNIEKIKKNSIRDYGPTEANYAKLLQSLVGDDASSNSPQVLHTEVNDTSNTDPAPGGRPNIPPYKSKKRKP